MTLAVIVDPLTPVITALPLAITITLLIIARSAVPVDSARLIVLLVPSGVIPTLGA